MDTCLSDAEIKRLLADDLCHVMAMDCNWSDLRDSLVLTIVFTNFQEISCLLLVGVKFCVLKLSSTVLRVEAQFYSTVFRS